MQVKSVTESHKMEMHECQRQK